ncbi:MAG: hypothetical protein EAZ07_09295 [Cytophagales bacterium]|nr:MAG: hypothetical protein EAZ07_09295 [Cytophagales bacterium]
MFSIDMNRIKLLLAILLYCYSWTSNAQQSQINDTKILLDNAKAKMNKLGYYQQIANKVFDKAINTIDKIGYNPLPLAIPFSKNPVPSEAAYELRLNSISILPNGAKADLYMRIDKSVFGFENTDPSQKYFYMAADEVSFTRNGGFTGETNLILLGDVDIKISEGVNLKIFAINPNNQSVTHARFDCDGFIRLHLSAALEVSNSIAVREDENGKATDKPLYIEFETDVSDLNDWLFEINKIPAFQFKSMPDFSVAITSLVYDKSMIINSPAMPKIDNLTELWKGFYCKQATIKMPKYMRSKSKGTERISIDVANLRIDNSGFGGSFSLSPVFSDGQIGTWQYTVDKILGNFVNSKIDGFVVEGMLEFPIAKQNNNLSEFQYSAGFVNNKIVFNVKSEDKYDFSFLNALNAEVVTPTLNITVNSNGDEFIGSFTANVNLTLNANKNTTTNKPSAKSSIAVVIEDLVISSLPPYISAKALTISGSNSYLNNFPITIKDPSIGFQNGNIKLGINIGINFIGNGDNASSFGANGSLAFYADRDPLTNRWKFKNVVLSKLCLDVISPGFDFSGCLEQFEDNDIYGNGFQASLKAKFIKKIEVQATAMFGKTDGENGKKYWYVDAGLTFPAFPIFTGVGLNGFYGGAYYNMTLCKSDATSDLTCESCNKIENKYPLGCNTSGLRFIPYINNSDILGVRAGVGLVSMPTDVAFSGNITFGIEFVIKTDNSFSVNKVTFDGLVKFINTGVITDAAKIAEKSNGITAKVVETPEPNCDKGITVKWVTQYDVNESTLSGTFGVRVNIPAIVSGSANPNICEAGNTEIFFSPKDWYVWVGTPSMPMGLNIINIFNTQSYFNMGTKLPTPPIMPLPSPFKIGVDNSSLATTGAGFAFGFRAGAGVNIRAEAGGKGCSVWGEVKCNFSAGADILIAKQTKYEGMNQWHAKGQAFVLASAKVNAGAKCVGVGGELTLGAFYLGAALAAQTPKPTFISGQVLVGFEILLFKGDFVFDFRYPSVPPSEIDPREYSYNLIQKVYPSKKTDVISPYEGIQLTMSRGANTSFTYQIPDLNKKDEFSSTKINIGEPNLTILAPQGSNVKFKTIINEKGTGIAFIPNEVMAPGVYEAKVSVPLKFELGGNSTEEYGITFTVKEEGEQIPLNLIVHSYPLPNMNHFYKSTGSKGYIRLNTIPSKPTKLLEGQEFVVRFISSDNKVVSEQKVDFNNNINVDNFEYNIPAADLQLSTKYMLKLIRRAAKPSSNTSISGITSGVLNPIENKEDVILEYPFTTSRFATFESKLAALSINKKGIQFPTNNALVEVPLLIASSNTNVGGALNAEPFDEDELQGYFISEVQRIDPLVMIVPDIPQGCSQGNAYYKPMITQNSGGNSFWFCTNSYDNSTKSGSGKVAYYLPGRKDAPIVTSLNF